MYILAPRTLLAALPFVILYYVVEPILGLDAKDMLLLTGGKWGVSHASPGDLTQQTGYCSIEF